MIEVGGNYITAEVADIISELKTQLALNGVKRFYKTTDTPQNTMVCCPFHKEGQEKRPSMGIYKKDGTCHCFACGWVGSLSELISNCFGYDDMGLYGNKWLVRNFLTLQVEERKDIELDMDRNARVSNHRDFISAETLDKYRWTHPYWAKRGITNEGIIELFDLGYDKETDCITFPIRDIMGNCLFVARRSVSGKYFNYPSGVEKPLYGLYELQQVTKMPTELIICESMLDALTCWQYGKYAVALNGLGNELQFKQLNALSIRKMILATDNDEAGKKAKQRLRIHLSSKIITEYIVPQIKREDGKVTKDINDLTEEEFNNLQEFYA